MLALAFAISVPQQHYLTSFSDTALFQQRDTILHLREDYSIEQEVSSLTATVYGAGRKITCIYTCFDSVSSATVLNVHFVAERVAKLVTDSTFINVTISGMLATQVTGSLLGFLQYSGYLATKMGYTELYNTSFYTFPVIYETQGPLKVFSSKFSGAFGGFCQVSGACDVDVFYGNMVKMVAGVDVPQTPLFGAIDEFYSNEIYTSGYRGLLFGSINSAISSRFELVLGDQNAAIAAGALTLKKSTVLMREVAITGADGLFAYNNIALDGSLVHIRAALFDHPDVRGLLAGVVSLNLLNSELRVFALEARYFAKNVCLLAPGALLVAKKSYIGVNDVRITYASISDANIAFFFADYGDSDTVRLYYAEFALDGLTASAEVGSVSLVGYSLSFFKLSSVQVVIKNVNLGVARTVALSTIYPAYFDGENYIVRAQLIALANESVFSGLGEISSLHTAVIEFVLPDEFSAVDQALVAPTASGKDVYIRIRSKATFLSNLGIIDNLVVSFVDTDPQECHICKDNSLEPRGFLNFVVSNDASKNAFYGRLDGTCAEGEPPCIAPTKKAKCNGFGCALEFVKYESACGDAFTCISPFIVSSNYVEYYDKTQLCEFGYLREGNACSESCVAFALEKNDGYLVCNNKPETPSYYNAICNNQRCGCLDNTDVYNKDALVCDVYCPGLDPSKGICQGPNSSQCFINFASAPDSFLCTENYCDLNANAALCEGYADYNIGGQFFCHNLFSSKKCYSTYVFDFCRRCEQFERGTCEYKGDKLSYYVVEADVSCACKSVIYYGYDCYSYYCQHDSGNVCAGFGTCKDNRCVCYKTAFLNDQAVCQLGCDGASIFYGTCRGVGSVLCYGVYEAALDMVAVNCGDCRRVGEDPCGAGRCDQQTGQCVCNSGNYMNSDGVCVETPDCGLGTPQYDKATYSVTCRCSALYKKANGKCQQNKGAIIGIIVAAVVVVLVAIVAALWVFLHKKRQESLAHSRQLQCTVNYAYFYHSDDQVVASPE